MDKRRCLVSIGVPVYNGENFVAGALESLINQTFTDLEIVISDNASTDGTSNICMEFAARDPRIRYHRSATNRGAGWNHNNVVNLSTGRYFKWASHDDLCDPTLISKCVEVLERDPSVVIAYAMTRIIDERGVHVENPYRRRLQDYSPSPSRRFRELMWYEHQCFPIYGLIRADVLKNKTPLLGCHIGGDNVLLARLALLGPFHEIPEFLFFNRDHGKRSTQALPARLLENRRRLAKVMAWRPASDWWDTSKKGKPDLPYVTLFWQYFKSIRAAPISLPGRLACYAYLLPWLGKYGKRIGIDAIVAADLLTAPLLRRLPKAETNEKVKRKAL
jgi:glycosyltransferase involved in cell wall biosynthesis